MANFATAEGGVCAMCRSCKKSLIIFEIYKSLDTLILDMTSLNAPTKFLLKKMNAKFSL